MKFWTHPLTNMVLGVLGSIITAGILNISSIIEIRIPKTERLDTFADVLKKASEVISTSDKSLALATDVPAMGVISQNSEYLKYAAALQTAESRRKSGNQSLDVVWLRPQDEEAIATLEELSEANKRKAIEASNALRKVLDASNLKERTLPSLMLFYYWTGTSEDGKTSSVIAFNEGMDLNLPVKGFYTNSPAVHDILINVQNLISSDKIEESVKKSYGKIIGCK